jgi:hypothetical protein
LLIAEPTFKALLPPMLARLWQVLNSLTTIFVALAIQPLVNQFTAAVTEKGVAALVASRLSGTWMPMALPVESESNG